MRGHQFTIEQVNIYLNAGETVAKGIEQRPLVQVVVMRMTVSKQRILWMEYGSNKNQGEKERRFHLTKETKFCYNRKENATAKFARC